MSGYNDSATFDRDDDAIVPDADPTAEPAPVTSDADATTPGIADAGPGPVDAADAEFLASGGESVTDAASGSDAADGPVEPDDRFVEDGAKAASIERDDIVVPTSLQPGTQDDDPVMAELGEDGQGDLAPEDEV